MLLAAAGGGAQMGGEGTHEQAGTWGARRGMLESTARLRLSTKRGSAEACIVDASIGTLPRGVASVHPRVPTSASCAALALGSASCTALAPPPAGQKRAP